MAAQRARPILLNERFLVIIIYVRMSVEGWTQFIRQGRVSYRIYLPADGILGSILRPPLFLTFIIDLPDCASSSAMLLYSDDAKCYRPTANPSNCQLLQGDLCRPFDWSPEWKLKFNIPKCVVLSFTPGNTPALSSESPCHIDDQDTLYM